MNARGARRAPAGAGRRGPAEPRKNQRSRPEGWHGTARWLRLGLRLCLGAGRTGLLRTALMSAGAATGVLVVLSCLASLSVSGAQKERAQARTAVVDESQRPDGTQGARPPAPGLRLIDVEDAIGTRPLHRIVIGGATPDSPRPPGLAALPAPGEAVVSPALADLMRTDDRARDRFPQRVTGTIAEAGLVAPDELRAYVGVPHDDPYLAEQPPVTGFGGPLGWARGGHANTTDPFTPGRAAAVAFALFVLVPYGVFLATCARLSASTRDRRIAALRLLGVSARQATLVNAVETGVVAAGGALAGAGLYALLGPLSRGWRIGRLHWYPADLSVPAGAVAVVLAATVLYAVLVATLATRPARVNPLAVRRGAPAGRPWAWRAAPVLLGLAAALLAGGDWITHVPTRAVLFLAAVLLTGLGLPVALPLLGYAVATLIARRPGTPVWLELAAARLRHSPGVAPRLVASLTVAVYVVGLSSLGVALIADDRDLPLTQVKAASTYQADARNPALVADLRAIPGLNMIAIDSLTVTIGDRPDQYLLLADCADITGMFTLAAGESCVDGETYRLDAGASHGAPADGTAVTENGVRIPEPATTLHLTMRLDVGQLGALLVTRRSPLARGLPRQATTHPLMTTSDPVAVDRAGRLISARAPGGSLSGDLGANQGTDADLLLTLLAAGLTVSFVLGIGSFAAAAVDRTVERRRDNATLSVVGASPRTVAAGEIGFAALPLLLGLGGAVLATVAVTGSLAGLLDIGLPVVRARIAPTLALAAAATVFGLVAIAVPARLTQRLTAEQLRRP